MSVSMHVLQRGGSASLIQAEVPHERLVEDQGDTLSINGYLQYQARNATPWSETYEEVRLTIWSVLSLKASNNDRSAKLFESFLLTFILLNTILIVLQTEDSIYEKCPQFFNVFEELCLWFFSVEYILRFWTCTVDPHRRFLGGPIWGRLKWMLKPLSIVDWLSVFPVWIGILIGNDWATEAKLIRCLRLFRILTLLKTERQWQAFRTFTDVFKSRKNDLLICMFVTGFLLLIFSTLVYVVENREQPDKFSSIPVSLWYGVAALTGTGYGDVVPKTPLGKVFGSMTSFVGLMIFAVPTGILTTGFMEQMQKHVAHKTGMPDRVVCPHCYKQIDMDGFM